MSKIKSNDRANSGRQASSRNATSHGLSCETFFLLPDEKQEDLDALAESLAAEYLNVASPGLEPLLQTLIEALWLQKRAYKKVHQSETALFIAESNGSHEDAEKIFQRLLLMQRYKTAYENSYQRALRAIEAFRKTRLAWYATQLRLEQTLQSLANSRLKIHDRLVDGGITPEKAWQKIAELIPLSRLNDPPPIGYSTSSAPDPEPPPEPRQ